MRNFHGLICMRKVASFFLDHGAVRIHLFTQLPKEEK